MASLQSSTTISPINSIFSPIQPILPPIDPIIPPIDTILPPIDLPQKLNFDLDFETNDQNLWGAGDKFSVQHNRFLGVNWNKSGSKEIASIGVQGSTNGKIGLQSNFELEGGEVDAKLPIDLWIEVPAKVKPGDTVTIKSGFALDEDATFSTESPNANYKLDAVFDVYAKGGLTALGKNLNLVNFDKNATKNLLDIKSGDLKFSVPESQLKGFGSFSIEAPEINTQGTVSGTNKLSGQGSDKFFDANLDLDKVATSALNAGGIPVPPLEKSFSVKAGPVSVGGGYNILDAELAAELNFNQNFNLEVDDLTGQLVLENGDKINFVVGQDVTFTVPDDIGTSLELDTLLNVDADFHNQTRLGYDVDAELEALSLHGNAKLNMPWPIPDIKKGFSLGPVWDQDYNVVSGDFNLYNKKFDLGGFNQEIVEFSIPSSGHPTDLAFG